MPNGTLLDKSGDSGPVVLDLRAYWPSSCVRGPGGSCPPQKPGSPELPSYLSGRAMVRSSGAVRHSLSMWVDGVYYPTTGRAVLLMYPRGTNPNVYDFEVRGRYPLDRSAANGEVAMAQPSPSVPLNSAGSGALNETYDEHVEAVRQVRQVFHLSRPLDPAHLPSLTSFGRKEDATSAVSTPRRLCLIKAYATFSVRRRGEVLLGAGGGSGNGTAGGGGGGVVNPNMIEGIDYTDLVDPGEFSYEGTDPYGREPGLMNFTSVAYSPDCGVALGTEATAIEVATYARKVSGYVMMTVLAGLSQMYVLLRQAQSGDGGIARRVSLGSVGMMAMLDAYMCLFQLSGGVLVPFAFSSISIAVFLKFVIFSVFEMRVMVTVWKARRRPGDPDGLSFVLLFTRFYALLALGFFVLFALRDYFRLVVLVAYSFWVPQIAHNALGNVRRSHETRFIVLMSASRLAVPLYFSACPRNFLGFEPGVVFPVALTAWVAAQAAVLLLQERWGPRFLLPRALIPRTYDYQRVPMRELRDVDELERGGSGSGGGGEPDEDLGLLDTDGARRVITSCVICMADVTEADVDAGATMYTPCGHLFHEPCLSRWMEIRLECPTCRAPLPPG